MTDPGMATTAQPASTGRARLGDVTTTTLVHRRTGGATTWWQQAVVFQVAVATDVPGLEALAQEISHVARLGADAIQVHCPGVDPAAEPARTAVDTLVRRAHQRGVKVIVTVVGTDAPHGTDPAWHLARCAAWLDRGVDGIDLSAAAPLEGPAPQGSAPLPATGRHEHAGVDLGGLQALLAEHGEDTVATGAGTAVAPRDLAVHLHEDWLHITRDDRLVTTPWQAAALRTAITDAYALRDPVGATAGWTLLAAPSVRTDDWTRTDSDAWRRRHDAATLLMLALPGTAYVPQGEAVGLTAGDTADGSVAATVRAVAEAVAQQKGRIGTVFERYRQALRLRAELHLGTGTVAWVDAPGEGALAFLNRRLLVLVNVGPEPVLVPAGREILHASDTLSPPLDGDVVVPPDTTVWMSAS
ncbi:DUF3459 domain-containing protein [Georgenia yuyongxinii]|uniref:DUF3459 domain-containing protein n=1 Tax=Georgenia yuyongxinii TaxID=2589797 RepID=A0A5B8C3R2_9MICO|nr:DUF3459 domain-containing protein [Georgenia yuyongxinii]QDC24777.1 DUF3459 domain-containing protein [Georgenia yuyongxinii]